MLDELARRVEKPIGDLPSNFMLDSATYEHGNELGFDGLDFYVCGRGGALGSVDAGVVSAAFVFFSPAMIRDRWERGRLVMTPPEAAIEFAHCMHRWSSEHLDADLDYEQLTELLGRIVSAASRAGAPLFAGWMTLPEPEDPRELAMHRLNALRELRGALHGGAVLAAGLDPLVALLVKTPFMAGIFGWDEPYPDVELAREAWADAEAATNRAMGRVFGVLTKAELASLAELLDKVHSGVH
ncbi:MAG: SCO6745 family protein [Acidimicrobiales bacterium]